MPQPLPFKSSTPRHPQRPSARAGRRLAAWAGLSLCFIAGLTGCAQSGRSTLGGPADPTTREEQQRARGSMHPMPPGQNMPGGGEASGGAGGAEGSGSGR
jgi:hypothetical protein